MAEQMPWFKVYAAELLSDEGLSTMTLAQQGAWLRLICHAWKEGSIPSDLARLAALLGVDAVAMRSLWEGIAPRFQPHPDAPGRLTSERLEQEREEALEQFAKKSEAGKKAAKSRWGKKNQRHADALRSQSDGSTVAVRPVCPSAEVSTAVDQHSSSIGAPPPPELPTRAQHLARQAPLAQQLVDALATDGGWVLSHAAADRRAAIEAALAEVGLGEAASFIRFDLADRAARGAEIIGSVGFYLGDLVALGKRRGARPAPPTSPVEPDLAWIDRLPDERRTAARAAWEAKAAEVATAFHPSAQPKVLVSAADLLRREFTNATH